MNGEFPYGYTQSPNLPAPEVSLAIQSPVRNDQKRDVVCVIDTGACVSCMPRRILEQLELKDYTTRNIAWGSGRISTHRMFAVNLVVYSVLLNDIWILETDKTYGLLGRDVLNAYRLLCDGPSRKWNVEPRWI